MSNQQTKLIVAYCEVLFRILLMSAISAVASSVLWRMDYWQALKAGFLSIALVAIFLMIAGKFIVEVD